MAASGTVRYLAYALIFLGWSSSFAEPCRDVTPSAWGSYEFRFPDYIGDLEFFDQYYNDDPRLGYTTRYQGNGIRLSIFIYTDGIADIPDGIDSGVLRSHYEKVKSQLKESGVYSRATLQSERQTSFGAGALPVLEAFYLVQAEQSKELSFIYLTAKYGGFIKVRLNVPAEMQGEMMTVVNSVRPALGDIFCETASAETNSDTNILSAIERMLRATTVDDAAEEMPDIISYATYDAAPVRIFIDENFMEFSDDFNVDTFLMAFYMAGAIKYDLEHPAAFDDPRADIPSAIRAMITGLRIYRTKDPSFEHPFVDELARIDAAGRLEEYVNSRR